MIAVALAYETSALTALQALDGVDREAQRLSLQRFSAAVAAFQALPPADRDRCLAYLAQRQRIPGRAWDVIARALPGATADGRGQWLQTTS